ncbi:MAG: hypothetical protein J5494_09215, partial [Candidatus Methanomethylophilaceae archaeon]|nr:hypothetical protein [Candidatus Methanomethylophilaceae archaeon]
MGKMEAPAVNVHPDSFIGTVMAVEGIADAAALLHGPDGCRKNLSSLSGKVYPRDPPADSGLSVPYYRGIPRVPCTEILSDDYISGAEHKVADALSFVCEREKGPVAIVCTPGASLIGDDINKAIRDCGAENRALNLDADTASGTCAGGLDSALARIADFLIKEPCEKKKGTVNVLGVNILTKDWISVREEFENVLGLMDLDIICFLGAGCTSDEIRASAGAEYNIVLSPEYCGKTSEYYEKKYGIKPVGLGYAPVG